MTQNIYDKDDFFAGYAKLKRSEEGLAGAPEWPSMAAMLPDLTGLSVLDLGCGFGWFCRYAREKGAGSVIGGSSFCAGRTGRIRRAREAEQHRGPGAPAGDHGSGTSCQHERQRSARRSTVSRQR